MVEFDTRGILRNYCKVSCNLVNCSFYVLFEVHKEVMEVSELKTAITELTARIDQIRDWL